MSRTLAEMVAEENMKNENLRLREALREIATTPISLGISPVEMRLWEVVSTARKALEVEEE